MSYNPFYISSFENESGLDRYYESFLIPEKAFPTLEDAFAWRGRIRRRDGFALLGRLRRVLSVQSLGNSGASPWSFNIYSTLVSPITGETNAQIQIGSVTIVLGGITFTDNSDGTLTGNVAGNSGTINYATGGVVLTHTAGAGVATTITFSYYPGLPVMGLPTLQKRAINENEIIAFDTKYAYRLTGGQFEELPSVAPTTWNGTNSDLFWSINYFQDSLDRDLFWTTNFNKASTPDPIRYWDTATWNTFNPIVSGSGGGAIRLQQCRILVPYKDRLVAFNTYEGTTLAAATQFPQRARWSNAESPLTVDSWNDDIPGQGTFYDAPTNEQIVSVEFIKDVLLVKFERSSWKFLFTGNEFFPFTWQKINTEFGAESTFSLIPFDKGVLSVGNVGVMTDDSVNVERIDTRIPQVVFDQISNNNQGPKRVYGIRDYANEVVYWSFPNADEDPIFPNKILLYNYVNQTWAIFNDSFTCFGYFQRASNVTWATLPYLTWDDWPGTWSSGSTQSKYPNVIGGNQHGFVEILVQTGPDNDPSLYIKSIIPTALPNPVQVVIPNHNLQTGQFVKFSGIMGIGSPNPSILNNIVYKVLVVDANTITMQFLNSGILTNQTLAVGGTYIGGGVVEILNNINITTKRFSPLYQEGSQVRLGYIDFFFDRTANGEITVNLKIDETDNVIINDNSNTNIGILGTNVVLTRQESTDIPYQANQQKIWHRLYTYAICQNFQITLTFSDAEMFDEAINASPVLLHAMTFYLSKNARMIQ